MPRPGLRHSRRAALLVVLAVYPAGLLGYVWYHCWSTGLEGGKNGPLDAYRHALSSAMVAYYDAECSWIRNTCDGIPGSSDRFDGQTQ